MNYQPSDIPPSAKTPYEAREQAYRIETMKLYGIIAGGVILLILTAWFFTSASLKQSKISRQESEIGELKAEVTKLKEDLNASDEKSRELATSESQTKRKYKDLVDQLDEKQRMIDHQKKLASAAKEDLNTEKENLKALQEELEEKMKVLQEEFDSYRKKMEDEIEKKNIEIEEIKRSLG
ncbi:MAG: hypothetical protein AAGA18_00840 [Verrucomicrobiota bacterium]